MPVELTISCGDRLAEPVEVAAFYVVSEALANVAKYAQRDARACDRHQDRRRRSSSRSPTTASAAPTRPQGTGLRGLVDRVEALDGRLVIVSPPGAGRACAPSCRSLVHSPRVSVTLLFTDIEGSTALVQELGDGYADVLGRAPRAVREAVAAHGGRGARLPRRRVLDRVRRAGDAALDGGARDPGSARRGRVRVRIGIHTGEPSASTAATSASTSTAPRGSAARATAARCSSPHDRARRRQATRSSWPTSASTACAGCPSPERIFQLLAPGLEPTFRRCAADADGGRPRRAHARRPRRRLGAAARGHRAPARGRGLRDRRPVRHGRRPAAEGALVRARRRDRRHPHAADAHRRGPRAAQEIREQHPGHGGARPLAVRRVRLRARAAAVERRGRRLPAQGPRRRRRRVRRRGEARRRRRLGARPGGRLAARRPAPRRRPALAADAARARGARADGGGPLEPGDRRAPRSSPCAPSRST